MLPEMILLPDGRVLIINGAASGYAGYASTDSEARTSNSDHPVYVICLFFLACLFFDNLDYGQSYMILMHHSDTDSAMMVCLLRKLLACTIPLWPWRLMGMCQANLVRSRDLTLTNIETYSLLGQTPIWIPISSTTPDSPRPSYLIWCISYILIFFFLASFVQNI